MGFWAKIATGLKGAVKGVENEFHKVEDFKLPTLHVDAEADLSKASKQITPMVIGAGLIFFLLILFMRKK